MKRVPFKYVSSFSSEILALPGKATGQPDFDASLTVSVPVSHSLSFPTFQQWSRTNSVEMTLSNGM